MLYVTDNRTCFFDMNAECRTFKLFYGVAYDICVLLLLLLLPAINSRSPTDTLYQYFAGADPMTFLLKFCQRARGLTSQSAPAITWFSIQRSAAATVVLAIALLSADVLSLPCTFLCIGAIHAERVKNHHDMNVCSTRQPRQRHTKVTRFVPSIASPTLFFVFRCPAEVLLYVPFRTAVVYPPKPAYSLLTESTSLAVHGSRPLSHRTLQQYVPV